MLMSGTAYVCSGGESFDSVAFELYGDERRAAELLCANPEYCHKTRFDGGEALLLPEIESEETDEAALPDAPPWRN